MEEDAYNGVWTEEELEAAREAAQDDWQKERSYRAERGLRLWRSGFSVIPLCWPDDLDRYGQCGCGHGHKAAHDIGKAPIVDSWRQYATGRPAVATVREWSRWYPEANWGVICGAVSGVVVLDFDSAEGLALWRKLYGPIPGVGVLSGGGAGRHFYLKWKPGVWSRDLKANGTKICEVRADGRYVVSPGGRHASGGVYRADPATLPADLALSWWRGDINLEVLPEVPDFLCRDGEVTEGLAEAPEKPVERTDAPEWVIDALGDWDAASDRYNGDRSNAVFGIIRSLLKAGWDDSEVLAALASSPWAHRDKDNPKAYFLAEVARAHRKAGGLDADAAGFEILPPRSKDVAPPPAESPPWQPQDDGDDVIPAPEGWPVLSDVALWGIAGQFVRLVRDLTEADPAALLLQTLTGLGCLLGPESHFLIGATPHPPRLFTVICGQSSKARKGTAWGYVHHFLRAIDPAFTKTQAMSGLSSGEGLIHQVRDPGMRRDRGKLVPDPGATEKRLLVTEQEFYNVLVQFSRDGNSLSNVMRTFWDGTGTAAIMTRNDPETSTGAHLCVIGHITLDELREKMSRHEARNGLGNRFLWTLSRRCHLRPHGEDIRTIEEPLQELATQARDVIGRVRATKRSMAWSPDAASAWTKLYRQMSEPLPGIAGDLTARGETYTVRLALLYALLDDAVEVDLRHLDAALAVWDYCQASASYIWNRTGASDPDAALDLTSAVYEVIRAHPEGIRPADAAHEIGGSVQAKDLQTVLGDLRSRHLIEKVYGKPKGGRAGRPPLLWRPIPTKVESDS